MPFGPVVGEDPSVPLSLLHHRKDFRTLVRSKYLMGAHSEFETFHQELAELAEFELELAVTKGTVQARYRAVALPPFAQPTPLEVGRSCRRAAVDASAQHSRANGLTAALGLWRNTRHIDDLFLAKGARRSST
ncbi:unnamed protein product [Symbiodinium microadriaticum]|nr:unnamed protein product [Symbiodinium microadriaticum]